MHFHNRHSEGYAAIAQNRTSITPNIHENPNAYDVEDPGNTLESGLESVEVGHKKFKRELSIIKEIDGIVESIPKDLNLEQDTAALTSSSSMKVQSQPNMQVGLEKLKRFIFMTFSSFS